MKKEYWSEIYCDHEYQGKKYAAGIYRIYPTLKNGRLTLLINDPKGKNPATEKTARESVTVTPEQFLILVAKGVFKEKFINVRMSSDDYPSPPPAINPFNNSSLVKSAHFIEMANLMKDSDINFDMPFGVQHLFDGSIGVGSVSFRAPAESRVPDTAKDSAPPISSVPEQDYAIPIDAQASLELDTRGLETAEREAVVKVRFGQGSFREALFRENSYGGKCWMSGIEGGRLLVASHIKPWSHCEADPDSRGRTDNGLLLSALWDAAFDAGLVSFDPDWKVVVSSELSESAKYALNLNAHSTLPEIFRTEGRKAYLAYHYANMFEYWKNKDLP